MIVQRKLCTKETKATRSILHFSTTAKTILNCGNWNKLLNIKNHWLSIKNSHQIASIITQRIRTLHNFHICIVFVCSPVISFLVFKYSKHYQYFHQITKIAIRRKEITYIYIFTYIHIYIYIILYIIYYIL